MTAASRGHVQQASPDPATGVIVGQVIDSGRRPVALAIVSLTGGPATSGAAGVQARVRTDAQGEFVFTSLAAGQYDIVASKVGYSDGRYGRGRPDGSVKPFILSRSERRTDVTIMVWKHAAISGRVTDDAGQTVVGAIVVVLQPTSIAGHPGSQSVNFASTDDRGAYRISGLLPGDYAVVCRGREAITLADTTGRTSKTTALVYRPTYYPAQTETDELTTVTLAAGQELESIDLALTTIAASRVSGRIANIPNIDPPGPRPNVQLLADPTANSRFDGSGFLSTSTDAAGRFTFEAVPAGQYQLRATQIPSSRMTPGPPEATTVIQTPSGTITSRSVVAPSPPARAPVSTESTWWASQPLAVGTAEVDEVVLSMRPGLQVTGSLQFDGAASPPSPEAISRAFLSLEPADGRFTGSTSVRSMIGPDGRFTIAGVISGRYVVRTDLGGAWRLSRAVLDGHDLPVEWLDVGAKDISGVVLVLSDRWPSVTGTVRDPNGQPEEDAAVLLFPTDPRLWVDYGSSTPRIQRARTLPGGKYVIDGVPPGDYFVVAASQDLGGAWLTAAALRRLSQSALVTSLADGERRALDLRAQTIR
jgi:protocatechuate 3,4-dioxygenase beta subunit